MDRSAIIVVIVFVLLIGSIGLASIKVSQDYAKLAPTACNQTYMKQHKLYIWLPGQVSDVFYERRINLQFNMINGNTILVNGIVDNDRITQLKCGSSTDYDFNVTMSDLDALKLATSTTPILEFRNLMKAGSIKIVPKDSSKYTPQILEEMADRMIEDGEEPVPFGIRNYFRQFLG